MCQFSATGLKTALIWPINKSVRSSLNQVQNLLAGDGFCVLINVWVNIVEELVWCLCSLEINPSLFMNSICILSNQNLMGETAFIIIHFLSFCLKTKSCLQGTKFVQELWGKTSLLLSLLQEMVHSKMKTIPWFPLPGVDDFLLSDEREMYLKISSILCGL